VLFFYGLNAGDFWRAESLRALVAKEVLRSGNWIVPTLYGQPLFSKPPGFYICVAVVSHFVGGVSEWAARFPSAVAASVTVFLVFWYFSRQLGRTGGLIAALILPVSFMWLDKASVAEIEMMHLAWTTAAILCLLRALEIGERHTKNPRLVEDTGQTRIQPVVLQARFIVGVSRLGKLLVSLSPISHRVTAPAIGGRAREKRSESHSAARASSRSEWFWWLAALMCVAGGFLTKWTTPVFFYLTATALLYFRGRLRVLLARPHLVGLSLAAGVCLFWVIAAIAIAGWQSFYNVVSREALARVVPGDYGGEYRWYEVPAYPLKIFVTYLPLSAFALLTLRSGFRGVWDERGRFLLQALHAWLWPNLIFWSFIAEHTPRHSFPIYPAISGMAAMVWLGWSRGLLRWSLGRLRPATVLATLLICWMGIKLLHVHAIVPARNQARQPRAKGQEIAAAVPNDEVLYVFQLKDRDEGILFYYGRPVQRLAGPADFRPAVQSAYCLLDKDEWQELRETYSGETILQMPDETGQPIVLARIKRD
jgi:4-amino-4-deoxy-L-arabinose transferase-like glycosyltransferase